MSKLAHLAQIMIILQYKKFVTALELSQVLNVDKKTVYRYIEALLEARVPVQTRKGRNGGFYLEENFFMKELRLSSEEVQALLMASEILTEKNGFLYEHQLKSAVTKIKNSSIEHLSDEEALKVVNGVANFNVKNIGLLEKTNTKIDKINSAIDNGKAVEIEYYGINKQELAKVTFDPYDIIFREADWITIGLDHETSTVKAYFLNRMKKVKLSEYFFVRPAKFSLEEFLKKSLGIFNGDKTEVVIRFSKEVKSDVCDVKWHGSQSVEELVDGSVLIKFYLDNFKEIKKWIIGFGKAAEVLSPLQLRQELKDEIIELQTIYNKQY